MTEPGPDLNLPIPCIFCGIHGVPDISHMRYLYVSTLLNAILRPSIRRAPGQWALAGCLQPHSLFSGACGLCALSGHLSVSTGPCAAYPLTSPKPHDGMNGEWRPEMPKPLCRGVFLSSKMNNLEAWGAWEWSMCIPKTSYVVLPIIGCGT